MAEIIELHSQLYEAKAFKATTRYGEWKASGTICGNIDFIGPFKGNYNMSPDEMQSIIIMLQNAREDVLVNSRPYSDPRIVDINV